MKKYVYCSILFSLIFFINPLFCFATIGKLENYANKRLANDINKLLQEKIPEHQLKEVLGFILVAIKKPNERSDMEKLIIGRISKLKSTKDLMVHPVVKKLFIGGDIYRVKKGDNLWKIAGKPDIYNDPAKWAFLYSANREVIKNPNTVDVGVVLKVPLSIHDYYEIYKRLMNEISEEDKEFFIAKFNENYDKFTDEIKKIICDDLKWCDIRSTIKYIKG